jgi:hypothetical protein
MREWHYLKELSMRKSRHNLDIDGSGCSEHTSASFDNPRLPQGSVGMLDKDIRPILMRTVRATHPGASLFEEFPVCREGRADLVAVNAAMWGYEIKSERDTLNRLPLQVKRYESIFDYCVIVAAERHLKHAEGIIPPHWGITSVCGSVGTCSMAEIRKPERNPNRRTEQLIRLLWKNEWVRALRTRGVKVPHSAPVRLVWSLLASLPVPEIEESVRSALKGRSATESAL